MDDPPDRDDGPTDPEEATVDRSDDSRDVDGSDSDGTPDDVEDVTDSADDAEDATDDASADDADDATDDTTENETDSDADEADEPSDGDTADSDDTEGSADAASEDAESEDAVPTYPTTEIDDEPETVGTASEIEDVGGFEGPESDEEMPLADHIEEMVQRLAVVLGVAGVVTLVAYPASEYLIEFLWQSYIPNPSGNRPHIYGPLEYVLTKLKVAGLSGTVVGLPVFVYQSYRFMKPGLYSTERRYYLASVPTSLILAVVGVIFAHLVILPLTMVYFTSYTADAAVVAFGLRETFNLIVVMMGYMAIVFQIPLFIMLAIMMGLVSREWMEDKRILFWGAFGGLAFTFVSVDPTGMAPIIIAVTMIVLFEGTLLLLRWTGN